MKKLTFLIAISFFMYNNLFTKEISISFVNINDNKNNIVIIGENGVDTLYNGDLNSSRIVKFEIDDILYPNYLIFAHFYSNDKQKASVRFIEIDTNFISIEFSNNDAIIIGTNYQKKVSEVSEIFKLIEKKRPELNESIENFQNNIFREISELTNNFYFQNTKNKLPILLIINTINNKSVQDILLIKNFIEKNIEITKSNSVLYNQLSNVIKSKLLIDSGKILNNFVLNDIKNNKVSLSDFKDNYILLNFWASWCGPCLEKIPKLKELNERYSNDLKIVTISLDQDRERWLKFLGKTPNNFTNLIDNKEFNLANLYSINQIPFTILINKKKEVIYIDKSIEFYFNFFKNIK